MSLLGATGIKLMENASLIIFLSRLQLSNACKSLIPVQQIYAFISPHSMRFKHTFREGWVFKCFTGLAHSGRGFSEYLILSISPTFSRFILKIKNLLPVPLPISLLLGPRFSGFETVFETVFHPVAV